MKEERVLGKQATPALSDAARLHAAAVTHDALHDHSLPAPQLNYDDFLRDHLGECPGPILEHESGEAIASSTERPEYWLM